MPDDSHTRVAALYLDGLSLAEVGREVGHAKSWVARVLNQRGVPAARPGRQ